MSFKLNIKVVFAIIVFLALQCVKDDARADELLSDEYFIAADLEAITPYSSEEIPTKLNQAEKENSAESQYILARMYDEGIEVKMDRIKAEKLYLLAANNNLDAAQYALGVFYNYKGDLTKSRKWFNESAKSKNPKSIYQLGIFYELGRGVFQNMDKALEYFKESSSLGFAKASLKLALYYHKLPKPDYRKAMNYYKLASEQSDKPTKLKISIFLAKLYSEVADVQGKDEHVLKWSLKAAELGDLESQLKVGFSYLNGQGTFVDYEKASKWFLKAADGGSPQAMTMLGYMYSNGIGFDVNYDEAVKWYKFGAERGDSEAAWSLANMYLNGVGVTKNPDEAEVWFTRAETLKDKQIQNNRKAEKQKNGK